MNNKLNLLLTFTLSNFNLNTTDTCISLIINLQVRLNLATHKFYYPVLKGHGHALRKSIENANVWYGESNYLRNVNTFFRICTLSADKSTRTVLFYIDRQTCMPGQILKYGFGVDSHGISTALWIGRVWIYFAFLNIAGLSVNFSCLKQSLNSAHSIYWIKLQIEMQLSSKLF